MPAKKKPVKAKSTEEDSAKQLVTNDMSMGEIVSKYPDTAEILYEEGLHCIGCMAAQFETLEEGLEAHGKSEEEIEAIVEKMNTIAKKK